MTPDVPALAVCGSAAGGGPAFTVAVHAGDGGLVEAAPLGDERGDLAVLVQRATAAARTPVRSLRSICVDRGPGSYTGLRVAVTFARTLAAFGGAQLHGTDSLALLGAATLRHDLARPATGAHVVVLLDGRQERLHLATFVLDGGDVLRALDAPRALATAELGTALHAGDLVIAPVSLHAAVATIAAEARTRLVAATPATAGALFDARLPLGRVGVAELEPLYLMGSYVAPV